MGELALPGKHRLTNWASTSHHKLFVLQTPPLLLEAVKPALAPKPARAAWPRTWPQAGDTPAASQPLHQ